MTIPEEFIHLRDDPSPFPHWTFEWAVAADWLAIEGQPIDRRWTPNVRRALKVRSVNVENIRALAARIRSPQAQGHFSMAWLIRGPNYLNTNVPLAQAVHECGTVACLCGWAATIAKPTSSLAGDDLWTIGKQFLGLTESQAADLFTPAGYQTHRWTNEQAACVLDHLAETGDVKWP